MSIIIKADAFEQSVNWYQEEKAPGVLIITAESSIMRLNPGGRREYDWIVK